MKENMDFKEFVEEVVKVVYAETGRKAQVLPIHKNNNVVRNGLVIPYENLNVSPVLYIDSYYENYLREGFDKTIQNIIEYYEKNILKENMDVSFFKDSNRIKSMIGMRLINYEKNSKMLESMPHIQLQDLAVVFEVMLNDFQNEYASILVKNGHLKLWGLTVEEMYEIAIENTKEDYQFSSLYDVTKDKLKINEEFDDIAKGVYVLTNRMKIHGAYLICHKNLLKGFLRECGKKMLVIIPSSVHEVLLIPSDSEKKIEEYNEMLQAVNETHLKPEEILSNHVYIFDGNEIRCV